MKRVGIRVKGIVQGVGFRPFVALLAKEEHLAGHVLNDGEGVYIDVEGNEAHVESFLKRLQDECPPLGSIHSLHTAYLPLEGASSFTIYHSSSRGQKNTLIAPDTAPCKACITEFHTPTYRRFSYPFINCTNCGPRYTIMETIPYDRQNTTMGDFPQCDFCEQQYLDETNRRYHAEPNACPVCGPTYTYVNRKSGEEVVGAHGLEEGRNAIHRGDIVALKGVGGFHLVCDAMNTDAVQTLRNRKQRPHKPLAVMVGSLERVRQLCHVTAEEEAWLTSPARPIVLLQVKNEHVVAPNVAPRNGSLGVMLPYAPIHYALLTPQDVWVMTSGNRSGDPVLFDNEKTIKALGHITPHFLLHNRRIFAPVDDSVGAVVEGKRILYRRARGYVPMPVSVAAASHEECIFATGSDLKNTFAMTKGTDKGTDIFMSPHLGDMESAETYEMYDWTVKHYTELFSLEPTKVVVDLHPNYHASAYGRAYSKKRGLPLVTAQHHHSHIAAVMAEYNLTEPVLGIALDGTGYGDDGTIWGGEILKVTPQHYERLGHIKNTPLPGGEQAIREPWRQGLWYLHQIYGNALPTHYEAWVATLPQGATLLQQAMNHGLPMIETSSAGRLFDAVGALLGLGYIHTFDGQIAMAVEQLADSWQHKNNGEKSPLGHYTVEDNTIDFMPLVKSITDGVVAGEDKGRLAAMFHRTLAEAVLDFAKAKKDEHNLDNIILSGGVFQNRRLLRDMFAYWPRPSELLLPRLLPPNDGGIALGQCWIALHS